MVVGADGFDLRSELVARLVDEDGRKRRSQFGRRHRLIEANLIAPSAHEIHSVVQTLGHQTDQANHDQSARNGISDLALAHEVDVDIGEPIGRERSRKRNVFFALEPPFEDQSSHENGGKHRAQNTHDQGGRKTADRTRAEVGEDDGRDQGGDVGVDN